MIGIGSIGRSIGLGLNRAAGAAAASWWTAGGVSAADVVAAYQPKGAASLAESYVNLAHPGVNDAAPGNAPDWDAINGWICSGDRLEMGITPGATWSVLIRCSGIPSGNSGYLFGDSALRFFIRPASGANCQFGSGGNVSLTGGQVSSGVLGMADRTAYINGVSVATIPSGSAPLAIRIADYQVAGFRPITGNIQAFAIFGVTLSTPQVVAISAAMAAL